MEFRHGKSKVSRSQNTPAKRKRSDPEMVEDEAESDTCTHLTDSVIVNHPIVLITAELLGGGVKRSQQQRTFSDDVRIEIGFEENKEESLQRDTHLKYNRKVHGLPHSTNLISDAIHGGVIADQECSNGGEAFDGGDLNELSNPFISCHNSQMGHSMKWPLSLNGKTKLFVPLKCGKNIVSFQIGQWKLEDCTMKIVYKPLENKRFVRPIYIVCANSDGTFEAPNGEDNSIESAKEKLSFNARMLQTFTAEHLNLHGFGRKTFRLEEDESGNVKVNIFRSKLDLNEALGMSGDKLYECFHEELNSSELYDPLCKFWVFMSCTRYMPPKSDEDFDVKKIHQYVKGHTALGGGNLALFGTGCLHTWARNLEEFVFRFTDDRKVDRRELFDDSAKRNYHWANYATTLGAAMHELGHTFNLPHTPSGIMGRGFDDMNIFFVGNGERNRNSITVAGSAIDIYKDNGAHWHRSSAAILSCSRWIGEHRDDKTPCEVFAPIMYNSACKRGPLGSGSDGSGKSLTFSFDEWLKGEDLVLRGFRIRAKKYINAIQIIGTKKETTQNDEGSNSSHLISSQWFGGQQEDTETHEFLLDKDDERLMSIDVRAGLWLDALRFHSSHKSTPWIGGSGGDLYNLSFEDNNGFDEIFGTAGGEHISSIGIARLSKTEQENDKENCYFYSHYGVRVVEVRQENGEVLKHWEFLNGKAQRNVGMLMDELFLDKAKTVAVYDGNGECAVYNIANFKRSLEPKT